MSESLNKQSRKVEMHISINKEQQIQTFVSEHVVYDMWLNE